MAVLIASAALALYGVWRERRARARFYGDLAIQPRTINPLESTFQKARVSLRDFDMNFQDDSWDDKVFIDCHLQGPAMIAILGTSNVTQCIFGNTNTYIIVSDGAEVNTSTMIVFRDTTFRGCRFDKTTLLVPTSMVHQFEKGCNNQIPWLNSDAHPSNPR